jgi:hypothetical protein
MVYVYQHERQDHPVTQEELVPFGGFLHVTALGEAITSKNLYI